MKSNNSIFYFLVFLFIGIFAYGQKVFKVTEGELQFINPEEGIYVKKDNKYYQLGLENISDYEELSKGFKYEFDNTTFEKIEKLKKDPSTIFATDIIKYDMKKLGIQKFTTKIYDDDNYQFYKYNKNFLSIAVIEDSLKNPRNEYLLHYCILDFGHNKKIIYHSEGFIVPTEEKVSFLFKSYSLNEAFKKHQSVVQYKQLKAVEIHLSEKELILNKDFYKIDTLKNKQLCIKDIYNQKVISKTFDSIVYNDFFIIGYKKNTINIYNYTFQKLKLKNVKAFSFERFYPALQIIENNELREINLIGENFKSKKDLSFMMSFSHFFPNNSVDFKIVKKNDYFYLETIEIMSIVPSVSSFENSFKLQNSNNFETVEFLDENTSVTLYSEMGDYSIKYPILIYTKLKNGKFNLNTIEYLVTENPSKQIEDYNNSLPKNLDSISKTIKGIYLLEKDGLFTYYPIVKEIKYKNLGKFQGNFARFELPNGQRGWLDLEGKEYLDN